MEIITKRHIIPGCNNLFCQKCNSSFRVEYTFINFRQYFSCLFDGIVPTFRQPWLSVEIVFYSYFREVLIAFFNQVFVQCIKSLLSVCSSADLSPAYVAYGLTKKILVKLYNLLNICVIFLDFQK